nr:MAG TPA: hypothetical protein [Caudoviricetes sp.]
MSKIIKAGIIININLIITMNLLIKYPLKYFLRTHS